MLTHVMIVFDWQSSFISPHESLLLLRRVFKHIHFFSNGKTVSTEGASQFSEIKQITDNLRR